MLPAIFFAVLLGLSVALVIARARYPGPDSGEFWSDANIINACRAYDQAGFRTTWGLPRIQLAASPDDASALYVSYPPGPYWISYTGWRLGSALGLDPLRSARLLAQTCGVISAILAYLVFTRLAGSAPIGALGALFYILSPAFLSYSAALHHMTYSPMLLLGAIYAWLAFERGAGLRRWVWLAAAAVLFAADCWTNLEHMFFFALFVGVRTLFHFRWPTLLGAAVVGPIPVPMMALRVLHNAQVLGGWDAAMHKFRSSATRRSGGGRLGVDLWDLFTSWIARLGWPRPERPGINLDWNQEFVYPVLAPWVLVTMAIVALSIAMHAALRAVRRSPRTLDLSLVSPDVPAMPRRDPPRDHNAPRLLIWTLPPSPPILRALAGGALLLACGLTWFVVMTQHTMPHRFIVLLLMPGLALLLGAVAWGAIASGHAATRGLPGPAAAWLRLRAWAVAGAMLAAFAAKARSADVLNFLYPLDPAARQRVMFRAETNARVAAAGLALAERGVRRIHMYDGANVMPWRAASIGLPFLYARRDLPEHVEPGDAVYAEAWDATELAAAIAGVRRWGLPELVNPPGDRTIVFIAPGLEPPPRGSPSTPPWEIHTSIPLDPDHDDSPAIVRARWAPTLLGDRVVLSLQVQGDLSTSDDRRPAEWFSFTLRARSADGQVAAQTTSRISWSPIRDSRDALVWLMLPRDAIGPSTTIELAIWDRRRSRAVPVAGDHPAPLRAARGGRYLLWPSGLE